MAAGLRNKNPFLNLDRQALCRTAKRIQTALDVAVYGSTCTYYTLYVLAIYRPTCFNVVVFLILFNYCFLYNLMKLLQSISHVANKNTLLIPLLL